MTIKQFVIQKIYPLLIKFLRSEKSHLILQNNKNTTPLFSFYQLKAITISGTEFDYATLKSKKVLLVNTASDCGFTPQFTALQKLNEQFGSQLEVIGFPANDFKEQEKNDNEEIAAFCRKNYGVTFTMMQKSKVIKTSQQNPVFRWLTHASLNGWNDHQPNWNFCKYLINEQGVLTHYFGPSVEPMSKEILKAIKA